jgi:outer membrane receptor protein involved in Fe transport
MRKSMWLLSAGLFALSTPAGAQITANPAAPPPRPTPAQTTIDPTSQDAKTPSDVATQPTTSPVQAGAVDDSDNNDEIVVTAQGRIQALQDVPIAVTAVTSESLQRSGATDIRQLNQLAPSLLVSSTGSEANGSARIRGIGTVGDNPGLESSVAVFIDGVYRSRSGIGLNELGELDRIEVLRGPQGTLFGRNASAGLINIISRRPSFTFGGYGEATIGNYDFRRVSGGITGPLSDDLAFRVDGVYVRREGFYHDVNNDTDVNNRKRYFVRGQLLYTPTDRLTLRTIVDYTRRDEKCCGAVYVNNEINSAIGGLNDPAQNNIVRVLRDLGQSLDAFQDPYSRDISVTPGRSYGGKTTDGGVSLQADYDFGGATLTSITAYRNYKSAQGSDTDYSTVDILYRANDGNSYRQFKTFTQELRLQGSLFDKRLDWLVGGFFANEQLTVRDNLRFGTQYGRFATCRIITGGGLAGLYSPASPSCVLPGIGPATIAGASGPISGADIVASFTRLDALNDLGTTQDIYRQDSRNFALFTHNIFHITDRLDFTAGLRYTRERKRFSAVFGNDNAVCTANQAALLDDLVNPLTTATARALAGSLIGLSCQGNSTAELNGVRINDVRKEGEFTGTAVLSYKPVDALLLYGSYSRGYKAGGFNLDRSALKSPIFPFGGQAGAQAIVGNLQFDPETVKAFELGGKYSAAGFTFNASLFRQDFQNFQLNTFDGTVFIVQNINGCDAALNGGDRDQSTFTTAPNFNAAAATTGTCAPSDVSYGVRSQGIELEASARITRDLRVNAGATFARTRYRDDLVGRETGAPLNQALRLLPGSLLSNAPRTVLTGAVSWTPDFGSTGLSGLFYIDGRRSSGYNTGSDLFPQKIQRAFSLVNARVGVRGLEERWALEFWTQNLLNKNYQQVAFNSPFQQGSTSPAFTDPAFPGGRQIFSSFLAEPRTFGMTLRAKFSAPRRATVLETAPPPPPPPLPTQTCFDGSVIDAAAACPLPAAPPEAPPAPGPERG